jgi:type III pantothenate kinase
MTKLVIDIGNTLTKVAIFRNQEMLEIKAFEELSDVNELKKYLKNFPSVTAAIVSSVKLLMKNLYHF